MNQNQKSDELPKFYADILNRRIENAKYKLAHAKKNKIKYWTYQLNKLQKITTIIEIQALYA